MKLNWFQRWAVAVCKWIAKACKIPPPVDIEKALKDALHKGIEITEKKYAYLLTFHTDPERTAAYEPPSPTTAGKIAVAAKPIGIRETARQAAIKRALAQAPKGTYIRVDTQLRHKKQTTGKLDPDTVSLETVPKQGADTRDLRKLMEDEDSFLL